MLEKVIKEYSNRQRIDINKSDGLEPNAKVVLLSAKEHEDIKTKLYEYNALSKEVELLKQQIQIFENQEQNLKEIVENVTAPIHEDYKRQLQYKDNQIKRLTDELNTLKKICNKFNIDVMSLNLKDRIFKGKLKELSENFNNSIWITTKDNEVDADASVIPGNDNNADNG